MYALYMEMTTEIRNSPANQSRPLRLSEPCNKKNRAVRWKNRTALIFWVVIRNEDGVLISKHATFQVHTLMQDPDDENISFGQDTVKDDMLVGSVSAQPLGNLFVSRAEELWVFRYLLARTDEHIVVCIGLTF